MGSDMRRIVSLIEMNQQGKSWEKNSKEEGCDWAVEAHHCSAVTAHGHYQTGSSGYEQPGGDLLSIVDL
jgi:hypothetical protein